MAKDHKLNKSGNLFLEARQRRASKNKIFGFIKSTILRIADDGRSHRGHRTQIACSKSDKALA
jgi:hypothetical protein